MGLKDTKMIEKKRKIIDVHAHAEWGGYNLKKTIENMDAYGITKACLLSCEIPLSENNPDGNSGYTSHIYGYDNILPFAHVLEYTKQAPDRFIMGYAPDPRNPAAIDMLEAAIETYGVKMYGEWKYRMMVDNPDTIKMFQFCGEKKLPVTIHLQDNLRELNQKYPRSSYWYGGNIDTLERALQLCGETIFIGHAMAFWSQISKDREAYTEYYPEGPVIPGGRLQELLIKYPNLYCDMSAGSGLLSLQRDINYTIEFFDEFQDRLLFGRDTFDNKLQEFINSLNLSDQILDKVYAGNIEKLLM